MSQESDSQGLFPEITLPRPSLGTLRASVSLHPISKAHPSFHGHSNSHSWVVSYATSAPGHFFPITNPAQLRLISHSLRTWPKITLQQKRSETPSTSLSFQKPGQRLQECLTSPKELLVTILRTQPQGSEQLRWKASYPRGNREIPNAAVRTLILLGEWASQPFVTASISPFYIIFYPLKAREEMYQ